MRHFDFSGSGKLVSDHLTGRRYASIHSRKDLTAGSLRHKRNKRQTTSCLIKPWDLHSGPSHQLPFISMMAPKHVKKQIEWSTIYYYSCYAIPRLLPQLLHANHVLLTLGSTKVTSMQYVMFWAWNPHMTRVPNSMHDIQELRKTRARSSFRKP